MWDSIVGGTGRRSFPTPELEPSQTIRLSLALLKGTGAQAMKGGGGIGRLAEAEIFDSEGLSSLRNFVEPGDHRIEEAEAQLAGVVWAEGVCEAADHLFSRTTRTRNEPKLLQ